MDLPPILSLGLSDVHSGAISHLTSEETALFCPVSPHGTEHKTISLGPKWCLTVTVTHSGAKLPLEDTSQGLSLFPLTVAEVRVPNLGSSEA